MNLVFVAIDTLRSDHLSGYGYPKLTSPRMDVLAERGTLFENFFSVGNCTHPGFTAMLTGRLPESTGVLCHWPENDLADDVTMMAERFARAGFRTGAVDNLFHGWAGEGWTGHDGREYPWFRRAYETYSYPGSAGFDIPADDPINCEEGCAMTPPRFAALLFASEELGATLYGNLRLIACISSISSLLVVAVIVFFIVRRRRKQPEEEGE